LQSRLTEADKEKCREDHFEGLRSIHQTVLKHGFDLPPYIQPRVSKDVLTEPNNESQCADKRDNPNTTLGAVTGNLPCPFCPPYNLPVTATLAEIKQAVGLPTSFIGQTPDFLGKKEFLGKARSVAQKWLNKIASVATAGVRHANLLQRIARGESAGESAMRKVLILCGKLRTSRPKLGSAIALSWIAACSPLCPAGFNCSTPLQRFYVCKLLIIL
jgi:hypothetical protein